MSSSRTVDHTTTRPSPPPRLSVRHDDEEEGQTQQRSQPKKRGPKPGSEAAKRGGRSVARKYGRAFYERIGHEGGVASKHQHADASGNSSDYYADLGRKGGETTRERHGQAHYQRIGRLGGQSKRQKSQSDDATRQTRHDSNA